MSLPASPNPLETDLTRVVDDAVRLLRGGEETSSVRATLSARYPSVSGYELGAALAMARSGGESVSGESTESVDLSGEAEVEPLLSEGTLGSFGHALLPGHVLREKILIPSEAGRLAFAFSASALPQHTLTVDDSTRVQVGGEGRSSLTVEHQRLWFALYHEAQVSGLQYRRRHGKVFLEITTSFAQLHRLTTPHSLYGGSAQKRLRKHLEDLRDTPFVVESAEGRSNYPLVYGFNHAPSQGKGNLTVWLHWRWSRAFEDVSKQSLKPFLFHDYVAIPSDYARLAYVHLDWVLANHPRAEITLETILERAGALDSTRRTAVKLRKYGSHQRWRLNCLQQLRGRKVSSGGRLHVLEGKALKRTAQGGQGYKLVVTRSEKAKHRQARPGEELQEILEVHCYRVHWDAWKTSVRGQRARSHAPPAEQHAA